MRGQYNASDSLRRPRFGRARAWTASASSACYSYRPPPGYTEHRVAYRANREDVAEQFTDTSASKSIATDLELVGNYDTLIRDLELYLTQRTKVHDSDGFYLRTHGPLYVYYMLKRKQTFSMEAFLKV
jgi:hypothetical protein